MDVIAHALWAGAAAQWLRHRGRSVSGRMVAATVVVAVLPDVVPLAPAVAWSFSEPAPLQFLYENITALPGEGPEVPAFVHALSHHLHCILHSVIVAGAASALLWWARPRLALPLLGWWLHIALDIPTHSDDYYAVPFLYPITYWGVNGVAWTEPWLLALNYLALAGAYLWLWRRRDAKLRRGQALERKAQPTAGGG
jgi:hypothetical protein